MRASDPTRALRQWVRGTRRPYQGKEGPFILMPWSPGATGGSRHAAWYDDALGSDFAQAQGSRPGLAMVGVERLGDDGGGPAHEA